MSASNIEITAFLQSRLAALGLEDVAAVQAARWLDDDALLGDSPSRPGKPLRDLLRAGKIAYAEQRPPTQNGRWFIVKAVRQASRAPLLLRGCMPMPPHNQQGLLAAAM